MSSLAIQENSSSYYMVSDFNSMGITHYILPSRLLAVQAYAKCEFVPSFTARVFYSMLLYELSTFAEQLNWRRDGYLYVKRNHESITRDLGLELAEIELAVEELTKLNLLMEYKRTDGNFYFLGRLK